MREIKFRGKDLMTGEWANGFLVNDNERSFIVEEINVVNEYGDGTDFYAVAWGQVDKETVGQFTGLKDKNGKEIYEGAILKHPTGIKAKVVYAPEHGAFLAHYVINDNAKYDYLQSIYIHNCEVIGNIYENPELLEVEE